MKLSRIAFDKAHDFIQENARPLEVARYEFHFGDGTATAVADALRPFQNQDGGFGNALEPDMRAPESSTLATSVALQIMRVVGGSAFEEMAAAAISYLLHTYDPDQFTWRIIPNAAQNSPHAPWWTQSDEADHFAAFSLNPTAEVLGYLIEYNKVVPPQLILHLSDLVLRKLTQLEKIEMHDLICCVRLLETNGLADNFHGQLFEQLDRLLLTAVATQAAEWSGYGLRPLQVASSPDAPFFECLQMLIPENLDFEIETQQDDGAWWPVWSWGQNYPDVWQKARVEWAGVITLEKLLMLRNYGRLPSP